jgi:hypothetical protein
VVATCDPQREVLAMMFLQNENQDRNITETAESIAKTATSKKGIVSWFTQLKEGTLHVEENQDSRMRHLFPKGHVHFSVTDMVELKWVIEDLNGVSYRSTLVSGFQELGLGGKSCDNGEGFSIVNTGGHICYFVELSSTGSVQSRKYWVGDLCGPGLCFRHKEQDSEDLSLHFKTSMSSPPSAFSSYDYCVAIVVCSFLVLETSCMDAKSWVLFGCFEICFPTRFGIRGEVLRSSVLMYLL